MDLRLEGSHIICIFHTAAFLFRSIPLSRFISATECFGILGTAYTVALRVLGYSARTASGSDLFPVWLTGILLCLIHSWPSKISVE